MTSSPNLEDLNYALLCDSITMFQSNKISISSKKVLIPIGIPPFSVFQKLPR